MFALKPLHELKIIVTEETNDTHAIHNQKNTQNQGALDTYTNTTANLLSILFQSKVDITQH